jgi:cation transport regulator ChaC
MYYFAYGSCMNENDFRRTVSLFSRLGKAELYDFQIGFTMMSGSRNGGVADIIESPNEVVEGILYEIDEVGLQKLDSREGHPYFYERILIDVVFQGKTIQNVLTYKGVDPDLDEYPPSEAYADIVLTGADESLSDSYVEKLRSHIHGLWDRIR